MTCLVIIINHTELEFVIVGNSSIVDWVKPTCFIMCRVKSTCFIIFVGKKKLMFFRCFPESGPIKNDQDWRVTVLGNTQIPRLLFSYVFVDYKPNSLPKLYMLRRYAGVTGSSLLTSPFFWWWKSRLTDRLSHAISLQLQINMAGSAASIPVNDDGGMVNDG